MYQPDPKALEEGKKAKAERLATAKIGKKEVNWSNIDKAAGKGETVQGSTPLVVHSATYDKDSQS